MLNNMHRRRCCISQLCPLPFEQSSPLCVLSVASCDHEKMSFDIGIDDGSHLSSLGMVVFRFIVARLDLNSK